MQPGQVYDAPLPPLDSTRVQFPPDRQPTSGVPHVHLAYVDDSGDSKHGTMLTALLVEDRHWNNVLASWLQGRREIHREFDVPKTQELHANNLYKGRGHFCDSAEAEDAFSSGRRAATGRIMLSWLAKADGLTIATIATPHRSSTQAYATFIRWLDAWAAKMQTTAMVFYDGQQGYGPDDSSRTPEQIRAQWDAAFRGSAPYRDVHRSLNLSTRHVIEDVVMQDSRYNQLIQAADLVAYGAYQLHTQEHPDLWSSKHTPAADAIRAYLRTKRLWIPDSDQGILWVEERKNP